MTTMTATQIAGAFVAIAKAGSAALPPNVQLALALADAAIGAVNAVATSGQDITDEQLAAIVNLDDLARADDAQAQLDYAKKQDDAAKAAGKP